MSKCYALDFLDVNGERTVWEQKSFDKHSTKHPELRDHKLDSRIQKAKNEPHVIIKSVVGKSCMCYYYCEFEINGHQRFTKVIVDVSRVVHDIMTAYRPDKIKELKYYNPKWIKEGFQIKN